MKNLILSFILCILSLSIYAQESELYIETKWEKFYGGNYEDKAKSIINTSDGGFVVAGWTKSSGKGGKDLIVYKLDNSGNKIWEKTYGNTEDDYANCIIQSNKKGYILAGVKKEKNTNYNYLWVLNIDDKGELEWEKTYGGSEVDVAESITNCDEDGYIITGTIESKGDHDKNIWVLKIDNKGQKEWALEYGERYYDDVAKCIIKCKDDCYLVAGYTKGKGAGEEDIYIMKIDKRGTKIWDKTYGGDKADIANMIIPTNDGRYLIVGSTKSKGAGDEDMYILKINDEGSLEWEKTFGGDKQDVANAAICTPEGGFVITGYTKSKGNGKENMYIIKLDSRSNLLWEREAGSKGWDAAESLVYTSDGSYVVAGWTESKYGGESDIWIIKLKDNTDAIIKNYVSEKLKKWELKGENEKEDEYKDRISDVNKEKITEDFRKEAINFYNSNSISNNNLASNDQSSDEDITYRGGGDPFKGLNINNTNTKKEIQLGNYYALIIGIDNYSGEWTKLKNAVKDAQSVEQTLKTKYKFDYFRTLYNEKATRENIINELEWLVKNVKEKDNVLIYYSGHGEFKQELNKGYWVPVDATSSSTTKYISNSDIQTFLGGIKSKHTLLIADACFSGDIFRGKTISVPYENSEKYYQKISNLTSRKAISSGGIEPVMDGGKEGHSVFAYYLLKALNGNTDKYYDASQLFEQLKIPVVNNSEQSPNFNPIKDSGDEGGQFIFIKK